ncbi:hypothetical protein M9H77_02914 [Catharanthus roseus]|uniref:Uncharacterized protein n=1 Tax=Catharanthus roseus TaxID=4058 RepID=A0ACC0CA92_CATRO|nr:hypothetical protein M9H77_02914 [Catharanthus roseus]
MAPNKSLLHLQNQNGLMLRGPRPTTMSLLIQSISQVAREWVVETASLRIIVEKSLDESVIEHFDLQNLFRRLGWVPFIRILDDYYPDLVQEFYANITHKTNKDLQNIISTVKRVRIILDRECLATILWILDAGNSVIVDSNRKIIEEDPDWNFDKACTAQPYPLFLDNLNNTEYWENEDYQQERNSLLNSQLLITVVTHGIKRTKYGSQHLKKIDCGNTTRPANPILRKM